MSKELLEQGQQWLEKLLQLCQMPSIVTGEERSDTLDSEVSYWLTIEAGNIEQIQALIGPGGNVIDAIQYLVNASLNRNQEPDSSIYYTVEISNYRQQRLQKLREIGLQAAEQVRTSGAEAEIRALSSVDRRQLHHLLQDFPEIETHSHGQEPDRRLIVRLKQ